MNRKYWEILISLSSSITSVSFSYNTPFLCFIFLASVGFWSRDREERSGQIKTINFNNVFSILPSWRSAVLSQELFLLQQN
jgi:hypothetical protein